MYSNDQTQIRAGLINYIGALLKASKFKGKAAKQNVVAILTEETLKFTQDKDKIIDLYVAKPIIKSTIFLLNQRIQLLKDIPKNQQKENVLINYKNVINTLEELINKI